MTGLSAVLFQILLSEARVLGLGPRFMSIYIHKLAVSCYLLLIFGLVPIPPLYLSIFSFFDQPLSIYLSIYIFSFIIFLCGASASYANICVLLD